MKRYALALICCLFVLSGCAETNLRGLADASLYYSISPNPVQVTIGGVGGQETAIVTIAAEDTVVYQHGYYSLEGQPWQQFTFTPSSSTAGDWLLSGGSGSFTLPSDAKAVSNNYIIVYSCSLVLGSWDCHGNQWQIQDFSIEHIVIEPEDPVCGDRAIEGTEVCDFGADNNVVCNPPYEGICSYCVDNCQQLITLTGPSCGDGKCATEHNEETICPVDCPIFTSPPDIDPKDIPVDRLPPTGWRDITWQDPGIAAWDVVDVTTRGIQPGTEVGSKVKSLIGSVADRTILYFPPGEYRFASGGNIALGDNIILRGAGSFDTTFVQEGNGHIAVYGSGVKNPTAVTQNIAVGDTVLHVASIGSLKVGDMIDLTYDLEKHTWCDDDCGGGVYEIVEINSAAKTITINLPITTTISTGMDPKVWYFDAKRNIGIEGIYFDNKQDTGNNQIVLTRIKNAFVRDVRSSMTGKHHVKISQGHNVVVENSFFDNAYDKGRGGNGYGVLVEGRSTQVKVENNIVKDMRHNLLTQQSVNYVIFGYNFNVDTTRDQCLAANWPSWCDNDDHIEDVLNQKRESDMSIHGHYANSQLWEGNIWYWGNIDNIHEENGPYNVVFRNKMLGQPEHYGGWKEGVAFAIAGTAEEQSVIGNVMEGRMDVTSAVPDPLISGNIIEGDLQWTDIPSGVPPGADTLQSAAQLPESLYLTSPPSFWHVGMAWPPYGPESFSSGNNKIPAQVRYEAFYD